MLQRVIIYAILSLQVLCVEFTDIDCVNRTCHFKVDDSATPPKHHLDKKNETTKGNSTRLQMRKKAAKTSTLIKVKESSCDWRHSPSDENEPYLYDTLECCDFHVESVIRAASDIAVATPKLGDGAKYIQRLLQLKFRKSFEVIMSRKNFGVSTYYHGVQACKVVRKGYFILAYATPNQYLPFETEKEELYSTIDSQDRLGSTKKVNVRGDFPDARYNPSAGETLSIQPSTRIARAKKPLADLQKHKLKLPEGTHCNHTRRDGNKCCNLALYEVMYEAVEDISSSPSYSPREALGVVANAIKQNVQSRMQHSFEVFVSTGNFTVATHHSGDDFCKYNNTEKGIQVMAYTTPKQKDYDPDYAAKEEYFSSISRAEQLGTLEKTLPCQRPKHTPLLLEQSGPRCGFPVGSHCSDETSGSRCCNLKLFRAMYATYERLYKEPSFNPFDKRKIATLIRNAAETVTGLAMETIVAHDDFGYKTYYEGELFCKFRVDKFYFMSYANPRKGYPLYDCKFVDNGPASPLPCPENSTSIEGGTCCDGYLHYKMVKIIDEATQSPSFNKYDTESLSRLTARSIQKEFPGSFETILSKSDFTMKTNLFNDLTCKVDVKGYHLMSYQSSQDAPPPGEFADPPPPPSDGGGGAAGGGGSSSGSGSGSGAGAAAAGGGACFSLDTWVTTPKGKKHMGQLQIGDFVLTANGTTPFFAPVTMWMHREPEVEAEFLTIMTEYGKTLRLTAKHLIFRNLCDEFYDEFVEILPSDGEAVFADELEKGDCMLLLYKEKWRQQRLLSIDKTKRKGIFAPMTANGRIIVNDMLASCYSDVKQGTLQTTFFYAINFLRDALSPALGYVSDAVVKLPFFTNVTMEILSLVIPQ